MFLKREERKVKMAVKQDFEKLLSNLKTKIDASEESASRPLIAQYIYLKYEYQNEQNMADTAENQQALERIKKGQWTEAETKRMDDLEAVVERISLSYLYTNLPVNERLYEFIHNFPIPMVPVDPNNPDGPKKRGRIDLDEEQEKVVDAEREQLRREDAAYLAEHPEDLYNTHGVTSPERYDAVNKKWDNITPYVNKEMYNDMHSLSVNGVDYSKLFQGMRFHAQAQNREAGVFCAFLMAKKGLSPDKAITFSRKDPGYQEALKEFGQFLYDNRVYGEPAVSPEETKKRIVNVVNLMKEATETLKAWKIPDIDYTDPSQVEQHKAVLMGLADMTNNFNQEFENFSKYAPNFMAVATEVLGGKKAYNDITKTWARMNSIAGMISDAYRPVSGQIDKRAMESSAKNHAFLRKLLGDLQGMFRGKTVGQYMEEMNKDPFYRLTGTTMHRLVMAISSSLNANSSIEYMEGKNKERFETIYRPQRMVLDQMLIDGFNEIVKMGAFNMMNYIGTTAKDGIVLPSLEHVFEEGITPQDSYKRMKNSEAGQKVQEITNSAFDKFTTLILGKDEMLEFLNKTDLDTIKIDGKTPEELYGEKYAFIEDEADRNLMIKAEVVNEITRGGKEVSVENYALSGDGKLERVEDNRITYSKVQLDDMTAYVMELNDLHENFIKVRDLFKKYQDDPKANFERGAKAEGSDLYQNMVKALNACITKTDVKSNQNATVDDIQKAMLEYQKAADIYYNARKGRIIGPITGKGQVRLGLADDAKEFINQRCDKLNILSRSFYTPKAEGKNPSPSIGTIYKGIEFKSELQGNVVKPETFRANHLVKGEYERKLDAAQAEMEERNKDLENNAVYKAVMKGNYKYPLEKWNEIQEKSVKIIETAEEHLKQIKDAQQKDFAVDYELRFKKVPELKDPLTRYVLGNHPDGLDANATESDVNEVYDRATEVITCQILANRGKRTLAQGIALEGKSMDDFRGVVHESLMESKAFHGPKAENMAKLMENNQLKDSFMRAYAQKQADAAQNAKNKKNIDLDKANEKKNTIKIN